MPKFVLPGGGPGLLVRGNIDIDARLKVAVPAGGGKFASVRTISFFRWTHPDQHPGDPDAKLGRIQIPGQVRAKFEHVEVLIPTVIPQGGRWAIVSEQGAVNHALSTGRHLGIFDNASHATAYGNRLHLEQAAGARRQRIR